MMRPTEDRRIKVFLKFQLVIDVNVVHLPDWTESRQHQDIRSTRELLSCEHTYLCQPNRFLLIRRLHS